jgi:hypothetical protein
MNLGNGDSTHTFFFLFLLLTKFVLLGWINNNIKFITNTCNIRWINIGTRSKKKNLCLKFFGIIKGGAMIDSCL